MTQVVDQKRELLLHPGEFCYMQDQTRGQIKTHVGPTVINQTAQELPVGYDSEAREFTRCSLEESVVRGPLASEGQYIILENPAENNDKPEEGSAKLSPVLKVGCKVNIPGPAQFALWPTQRATVLEGHHLRSNQYLLVRIYNETEARQNWRNAVAVRATGDIEQPSVTTNVDALGLTIGKLLIIKGTEVSFYIPPTGVEVIFSPESGSYIREAVTLERLEYAILVDENGNKRYEKGPQVVFPKPTELFFKDTQSNRKFKAIELNKIQGLHVKVIADYTEGERDYKVGDELFITGEQTPIYYPRVEHSIIRYGDKDKHYATAVPAGEGRYVMDRESGEIRTEKGPKMLLPDPRREVVVRRILTDKQVALWYPGNQEAMAYNQQLRAMVTAAPSARSGFVSEGDVQKNITNVPLRSAVFATSQLVSHDTGAVSSSLAGPAYTPDVFERGTSYQQPRTVTLDTKYEGVPGINVLIGYAVMVISKTGARRVVTGPATILLDYDESLEVLELSTGKPKNTDALEKTVYLRMVNNKVSDIVNVRTKDHVNISLKLSYRVNFEGEPSKWFEVENYVKFLCDHARSVLRGVGQKRKVEEFYTNGVDIIRDGLLDESDTNGNRSGMFFTENGMRMTDVEVLGIDVNDRSISEMLDKAQHEVVRANIQLHQAEKELEVAKRQEDIARERMEAEAATKKRRLELDTAVIEQNLAVAQARIKAELEQAQQQIDAEDAKEKIKDVVAQADIDRTKAAAEVHSAIEKEKQVLRLEGLKAETDATVKRFEAAQQGFSEALLQLQGQETLVKVAEAMSVQKLLGGRDFVEVIQKIFAGSGLESLLTKVTERVQPVNDGGTRRVTR